MGGHLVFTYLLTELSTAQLKLVLATLVIVSPLIGSTPTAVLLALKHRVVTTKRWMVISKKEVKTKTNH